MKSNSLKKIIISFIIIINYALLITNCIAGDRYIILNKEQRDEVRGRYGNHSMLRPIRLEDTTKYVLPLSVLEDSAFVTIWEYLNNLTQDEVDTSEFVKIPIE